MSVYVLYILLLNSLHFTLDMVKCLNGGLQTLMVPNGGIVPDKIANVR